MKSFSNSEIFSLKSVTEAPFEEFREKLLQFVKEKARIVSFFAKPYEEAFKLYAVLTFDKQETLYILSTIVDKSYPSLTPDCPSLNLFEREIFEQYGIKPENHPNLKPLRLLQKEFFKLENEEVHEVAVGPVHAGIIEPGHFRFQCFGENVLNLEVALGYQHRGIEKALLNGPNNKTIHYIETIAGDTTIGHALAYAQAIEALSSVEAPLRAQYIRAIALELERLANHTGNLGAIASDCGFLPTASSCGKLRGDFLNLTAILCGNRFGRGLITPGGLLYDLDEELIKELKKGLKKAFKAVFRAIKLLWNSTLVTDRLEKVGVVTHEQAFNLGVVGPIARSCNIHRDVRRDFPLGVFKKINLKTEFLTHGDVYARSYIRFMEIEHSYNFLLTLLDHLPKGEIFNPLKKLTPKQMVVSLTEGWRGEISHIITTDEEGLISHYKIVDPSFHNWPALIFAMKQEQIFNFPLCNASFNLSYCGHDL